ncbi:MAG: CopD family protein [Gammaproteobacteria bacterium]|nr:CopD family protein [Gammaproteobacteria bacterium]
MPFAAGPWELAIVLAKVLSYAGLASLTGGFLIFWLGSDRTARHLLNFLLSASIVGALAVVLFFLLQVGVVNRNGIAGMFDSFMAGLVLQSPIGYGSGLKLAGFLVAAVALWLARPTLLSAQGAVKFPAALRIGAPLAIALFAASFAVLGHVASLGVLARVAIAVHIGVMGLWIGALYPLYTLCQREPAAALTPLLHTFGQIGWVLTGSLLVAGTYLLTQLLAAPFDLISTPYGFLLLGKLLLVICLLGLAALNKFRLVPTLATVGTGALQRSIRGELVLALLILLLTACLTTFTGPTHMS